jgi:hypothetical protein
MCGSRCIDLKCLKSLLLTDAVEERAQEQLGALQQSSAAKIIRLTEKTVDTSLRTLLEETRHLCCIDIRDKVYAILSVAKSGCQGIEPDYTSTVPELLNKVLRNMHECEKTDQLTLVQRQHMELEELFAVEWGSIFQVEATSLRTPDLYRDCVHFVEFYRHGGPHPWNKPEWDHDDKDRIITLLTWCKYYGHKEIGRLIQDSLGRRRRHVESAMFPNQREEVRRDFDLLIREFGLL